MRPITKLFIFLTLLALSACDTKPETGATQTMSAASIKTQSYDAIVDANSPAAFSTIQAALDAAPTDATTRHRILIKAGRYKEKLNIARGNLEIKGEGAANTVIYFDAYAGNSRGYRADNWGTPGSATMSIDAVDVHISHLV